jgi:cellobiose phosphorylase
VLEAQVWPILAGLATKAQIKSVLSAINRRLLTKYGPISRGPSYRYPESTDEAVSRLVSGSAENGGISTTSSAWLIACLAGLGRGDEVYKLWQMVNPQFRASLGPTVFKAGPTIYPEFIYGPDHPNFGAGQASDNASAGWMWHVSVERILGLQPTLGGLRIDPCLPRDWRQVEISRRFRGAEYHIRIQNPFRVGRGVDRIVVDGARIAGNVIKPFTGGNHSVEVVLG